MYRRSLQNRITRNKKIWTCHLCVHTMRFCQFAEHLLSEKHKQNLKQIDEEQKRQEVNIVFELSNKQLKTIVNHQITFDKSPNLFNCHVCKCKTNGSSNTLLHIDSYTHVENFANYIKQNDGTVVEKTEKASCNNVTDEPSTEKSLTDQALNLVLQSESSNITCNEHANSDFCNTCKTKITTTPNISQHIQGSLHQVLEPKLEDSPSCSKSDSIAYDENPSSCQCDITKCEIGSEPNITHHDQEFLRQAMIHAAIVTDTKIIEEGHQDSLSKIALSSQEEAIGNNANIKNQDQLLEKVENKPQFSRICYCRPCRLYIKDSTLLKCHVSLHLHEEIDSSHTLDLIELRAVRNDIVVLHCLLCDSVVCKGSIFYAHQELDKHLKTNQHLNRLLFFNKNTSVLSIPVINQQINKIKIDNVLYDDKTDISFQLLCNVCDTSLSHQNKKDHTLGKNHKNKLAQATVYYKNSIGKDIFDSKNNLSYYSCFICDQSFSKLSNMLKHFETSEHQWKIMLLNAINKCTYMKFITKENLEMVVCSSCKLIMHDFEAAVNHVVGKHREEELHLPKNKYNSRVKNKTKNTRHPELNPGTKDRASVEMITLDVDNKLIKRPPNSGRPKLHRTRNGGDRKSLYAMNVLLYGKHYIKCCIDSGVENIYNVDDEKMDIFKLGVSLTFPYQSNRFCIPCEEEFLDDLESLFEHLQNQDHLAYINEIQVEDTQFYLEGCPKQFSDLQLAKSCMHVLDQGIQCNVCNIQINDDYEIIRQHLQQSIHKEQSELWKEQSKHLFNQYLTIYKDVWYYAEHFFCEICNEKFRYEIDFVKHLVKQSHKKKVDKHPNDKVGLIFNLCLSCATYWFGTTNFYEIHCNSDGHKGLVNRKDLEVPDFVSVASEFLSNIDENADILEKESNIVVKSKEETNKETELLKAIIETVNPVYPNAKAFIFGSRLSHLGFPSSDVDVFVDCENVYYKGSTKKQSQQYIESVEDYFKNTPNTWKVDEVLRDTRVPILKLRHIPTNLNCDISFINGLSVEKSKLVGLYNVAFPLCRKLILFMKKWLNLYHLFGSDCITTFAISWCAIFYLQLEGVLPSVHELMKKQNASKIVDGWEYGFVEIFKAKSSDLPFKHYLQGFFTFLANFDYQKSVMCPYLGKTIDKQAFAYSDELPIEMDIYKNRLKNNEVEVFRFDSPLCIQDPIDLSQNITKAVKKQKLRCFRQYCTLSAEKC